MVRCEYNQICEIAQIHRRRINEFNSKEDFHNKEVERGLYHDKCTSNYNSCSKRKKFIDGVLN